MAKIILQSFNAKVCKIQPWKIIEAEYPTFDPRQYTQLTIEDIAYYPGLKEVTILTKENPLGRYYETTTE